MRVVDDVLGTESEDIPLDLSVLDDPIAIFRRTRFPNGHYRIYLEELRTRRTRVILDVYIYNGRVVPPDFRESAAEKPAGAEEKPPAQPMPDQNGQLWKSSRRDSPLAVFRSAEESAFAERKGTDAADSANDERTPMPAVASRDRVKVNQVMQ
jgi:hypothetical protein